METPLISRKAMLRICSRTRRASGSWQHIGENGVRLFQAATELGVEGIVAKRADSPYRRGRTSDWVKIKTQAGKEIDAEWAEWNG
jgi:bifunctional non-homologous end joining protein LigD